LRVVRDGRLVSAPPTHVDAALTAQAMLDREVVAELIERALERLTRDRNPSGQSALSNNPYGRKACSSDTIV